ncbi:unnamed protein product [Somion occarium]|uniref:Histone-lysine N-methyltransferase, H3 lysine-36 specific n=1 Tax=Somion occarium TaxID=3059160 RepID=A0ABP1CVL6_9APHY
MSSRPRSQSPKRQGEGAIPPYTMADVDGIKDVVKLFDGGSVEGEPIDLRDKVADKLEEGYLKMEEDTDTVMGDITPPSGSPASDGKEGFSDEGLESSRKSSTPPVSTKTKKKSEPQLIGDLPRAEEGALSTFVEIPENHYQYNTLGRSRDAQDIMTCDCQYEHDDPIDACGDDCINRLTQVECLPDDCRCRHHCQNQRFQNKQYAPIEIVQTEKKGFGLRAGADLPRDTFIYEYVGDVVSQPSFLKRMRQYAEEGIRHFYFMMLQKDEFIDATKRGGIGRFANHSCNPNCYVARWTVGARVRMGIFASRRIKKDEELTFNYNVDRYGHDAQPCYCGEPNCVGFIGGKTQTDIAAMDDLFLDALGISDEVEQLGLKGSKKKKGRRLDEDYMPTLKPLIERDAPKIVQAMRQTQSRKVLFKLLTRVKMTEDQSPLRQIMRLRGFNVMKNILDDYVQDVEMITLALECMMNWPLIQRNKVEDCKITENVTQLCQSEIEALASLAQKLSGQWDQLEYAYRIPKRMKGENEDEIPFDPKLVLYREEEDARPMKRNRRSESPHPKLDIKPLGFRAFHAPARDNNAGWSERQTQMQKSTIPSKDAIAAVIAAAAAAQEAAALQAAHDAAQAELERQSKEARKMAAKKKASVNKEAREERRQLKEKRLLKLVGAIVVKSMSKYQKQMDHDTFKKHAKELTQLIAEKEKKSSSYKESKLDGLSDEKTAKIKKFAKEYIVKVLRKMEKKRRESSSGKNGESSSMTTSTPDDLPGEDLHGDNSLPDISLEDVMDIDGGDYNGQTYNEEPSPEEPSPEGQEDSHSSVSSRDPIRFKLRTTIDPRRHRSSDSDHDWAGTSSRIAVGLE